EECRPGRSTPTPPTGSAGAGPARTVTNPQGSISIRVSSQGGPVTISRVWRGFAAGLVGVVLAVGVLGAPAVAEPVGPAAPTVTADVYKENEVGGGVGQTGAFTFASSAG